MTNDEKQEILEDMRQEWKQELYEEQQLRIDEDYALDKFEFEIDTAFILLQDVCDKLDEYGWEWTPAKLIDRL